MGNDDRTGPLDAPIKADDPNDAAEPRISIGIPRSCGFADVAKSAAGNPIVQKYAWVGGRWVAAGPAIERHKGAESTAAAMFSAWSVSGLPALEAALSL